MGTRLPKNRLVVVFGPSAGGKGRLIRTFRKRYPEMFRLSVSFTSRPPRPGEVDGADYRFTDRDTFMSMVEQGAFAEWAEYAGNCYGTALASLDGGDTILEIERRGALQIRERYPHALFIMVMPPDLNTLRRRLHARDNMTEYYVERRITEAKVEIAEGPQIAHAIILNRDNIDNNGFEFESAYRQFETALQSLF
ncbi:MAG: guanylate kinase [Candidatus Peribacteraceae bacterium]|nr:guanylate kinase [Candidatus Peribacteraceae bacterium]